MPKLEITGKTDVGLFRSKNEDAFTVNHRAGYCLVADGIKDSSLSVAKPITGRSRPEPRTIWDSTLP